MAVRELDERPPEYAHFPEDQGYRWVELYDEQVYAHGAFAERDDFLEAHVSVHSWGKGVLRSLRGDFDWLAHEARRLGKKRIMGIRADDKGEFDPRLFKFLRLFGFREMHVFQTATKDI